MSNITPFILAYYNTEIVKKICSKYGIEPMNALRKFLLSQTYQMLADEKLEMWDFSSIGIFDMWENEQITGDPRNSLYLRRDELGLTDTVYNMYERYHIEAIENAFDDIDKMILNSEMLSGSFTKDDGKA